MAKKRLTPQDRIALDNWNELVASVREHSDINPTDTETEIRQRRERLEKNDEEWFKYYFAMYCSCESAAFHKKATGRLMRNNRWYEVRAWSRELAKSARSMMEISKLALTKKIRNVLLISNSADNAERLLLPFMANFEENQRIIQDYGQQKKPGAWETGEFTCMSGCSFRAIGAGQSPRGTRNKNFRPDFILVDDIDTDEECRNPERIKTKYAGAGRATDRTGGHAQCGTTGIAGRLQPEYRVSEGHFRSAGRVRRAHAAQRQRLFRSADGKAGGL